MKKFLDKVKEIFASKRFKKTFKVIGFFILGLFSLMSKLATIIEIISSKDLSSHSISILAKSDSGLFTSCNLI